MSVAQKDILNGWKEIAGYVARDIRTVERWEKQRGLPVRRVPGAGRATVYARISELEEWLASKPLETELPSANGNTGDTSQSDILATALQPTTSEEAEEPMSSVSIPADEPIAAPFRYRAAIYSGIAACLVIVIAGFFYMQHSRAAVASAHSGVRANGRLEMPRSTVPGVEEAYLRGSYLYEQRTPESLAQAVDSFNEAIRHDPKFAPAYAGLANTYNLLREYSVVPNAVAYPKARAAAEHAIALDPNLAEAHTSLAFVTYYWYMDSAKAEREFKAAIALDPTSSQAHHWYGSVLTHEGRFQEALRELDIAQHLLPSSSAILTSRAFALGVSGHAEQARAMLRDLLSRDGFGKDPNSITTHLVLGIVSTSDPKDWPTQFAQWREIAALRKKDNDLLGYLNAVEPAYKRGGERAMWQAALDYEKARHPAAGEITERMAQAEANLGNFDAAFADLNQLADRHDTTLIGLSLDPLLNPLHGDPRFAELRTKLGLPKLSMDLAEASPR